MRMWWGRSEVRTSCSGWVDRVAVREDGEIRDTGEGIDTRDFREGGPSGKR